MAKSELPRGWEWKRLGEACSINPRKSGLESYDDETEVTFVPMAAVDEGKGVISAPEIKLLGEVKKGYTFFQENDVLFAKITPCMQNGKSAIARNLTNAIGFGSTEFHVLRPQNSVLPEWIFHFVRQRRFRDLAASTFTGSVGQQRVPQLFLEEQAIPLPPLEEQLRIVARIEELLSRIEKAKSLRQKSISETSAIMASAINCIYSDDFVAERRTLTDVCTDVTDGTHGTPTYVADGVPFLTGKNIWPGNLDFENVKYITREDHERFLTHCRPERDDILLTLIGTTDKVALVGTDREFSIKNVGLLKPDREHVVPGYLYYFLQSADFTRQAYGGIKQAVQKFLGLEKLRRISIPIRSLDEQQRFVAHLDRLQRKVKELMRLQSETGKAIEHLAQSILTTAFRGGL